MSDQMEKEGTLLVERRGKIMIITLNRPEVANALIPEMAYGIETALNMAEADPDVYVVILTGAGQKVFCGGQDLKYLAQNPGNKGMNYEKTGYCGLSQRFFPKPIICAVNGSALGAGTEFALACDIVIAVDYAKFGLPEVTRGILAAAGGPIRLPRAIPQKIAAEMIFTGQAITAQRALELGLINRVVPYDSLMDEAMAMADKIIAAAPIPVRGAKELMYKSIDMSLDDEALWAMNRKIKERVFESEDSKEGPRAFAEKRAPVWKNR